MLSILLQVFFAYENVFIRENEKSFTIFNEIVDSYIINVILAFILILK